MRRIFQFGLILGGALLTSIANATPTTYPNATFALTGVGPACEYTGIGYGTTVCAQTRFTGQVTFKITGPEYCTFPYCNLYPLETTLSLQWNSGYFGPISSIEQIPLSIPSSRSLYPTCGPVCDVLSITVTCNFGLPCNLEQRNPYYFYADFVRETTDTSWLTLSPEVNPGLAPNGINEINYTDLAENANGFTVGPYGSVELTSMNCVSVVCAVPQFTTPTSSCSTAAACLSEPSSLCLSLAGLIWLGIAVARRRSIGVSNLM